MYRNSFKFALVSGYITQMSCVCLLFRRVSFHQLMQDKRLSTFVSPAMDARIDTVELHLLVKRWCGRRGNIQEFNFGADEYNVNGRIHPVHANHLKYVQTQCHIEVIVWARRSQRFCWMARIMRPHPTCTQCHSIGLLVGRRLRD